LLIRCTERPKLKCTLHVQLSELILGIMKRIAELLVAPRGYVPLENRRKCIRKVSLVDDA
jgi:hypothetical protein